MPDYELTVAASATTTDDLAGMLELAADRIRQKDADGFTTGGYPSVNAEESRTGEYRFVITSEDEHPEHFQAEGWTTT